MLIEKKKLTELMPADYNPRKALKPGDKEYDKLKRSLEQYGYVEPIIWNKKTGNVVGGHQRLTVLKDIGMTEVECVVVELDITHEKALNVALNKISGDWDLPKLQDLIKDLGNEGFDVTLTGFDDIEIDSLFKETLKAGVKEDNFDVDGELKKPVFSKAGDLWLLGEHRLYCGDSTKPESVEIVMGGKKANMLLTDPPYNVGYEGKIDKKREAIKNDKMPSEKFHDFLVAAFKNAYGATDENASIYVFHADKEHINFRTAIEECGFYISACCIWKKNSIVMGRSPYQWIHEPCLYGWKAKGKHLWYGDRKQTTVWEFDRPSKSGDHPTMKPLPLLAVPISNSTMTNCIVLDMFGGSGSTLIACEQLNRKCCTIELDEKYCDVIVKRYIEERGSSDGVKVIRDGLEYSYADVAPKE